MKKNKKPFCGRCGADGGKTAWKNNRGCGKNTEYTEFEERTETSECGKYAEYGKSAGNAGGTGKRRVRLSDRLCRDMPLFAGIALACVLVTAVCGIAAFAAVILPDTSGIQKIIVPDYTGKVYTPGDADGNIFRVIIEYEYDETRPAGVVIYQRPAAGEERKVIADEYLCTLNLKVSRGRNTVMIPDLSGEQSADAEQKIAALGLETEKQYTSSAAFEENTVISTEPKAFTDVPQGSRVILKISSGRSSRTVMPYVEGLSESEAISKLASLGIQTVRSEYIKSDRPSGTVIYQSVPFGSGINSKVKVSLTVSKGK